MFLFFLCRIETKKKMNNKPTEQTTTTFSGFTVPNGLLTYSFATVPSMMQSSTYETESLKKEVESLKRENELLKQLVKEKDNTIRLMRENILLKNQIKHTFKNEYNMSELESDEIINLCERMNKL